MKIINKEPTPKAQVMLKSLQGVAKATLDRKRKLGHYAVVWNDNKVIIFGDDAPAAEPKK